MVEGISAAAPLTARQAQSLAGHGLLADERAGLQRVWDRLVALWAEEVASARADLDESLLSERVENEWSLRRRCGILSS
jgi:hypothetical protein